MRENIGLFKAKDIETRDWREGCLIIDGTPNARKYYIQTIPNGTNILSEIYEIDPETLCEYTGLDNLYTHDFIRFDNGAEYEIIKEDYMFKISNITDKYALFEIEDNDWKLIGNKFDNPELLEVESETHSKP